MTTLQHRRAATLAALAASCCVLVACGSDSGSSGAGSSGSSGSQSASGSSTTASASVGDAYGKSGYGTSSSASAGASGGAAMKLKLTASEQGGLSFSKKALKAKAGRVTITMANPGGNQFPHAIDIEGHGVQGGGKIAQPGGDSTVTVKLKPGRYTFFCPVGDHRKEGMVGTLTVR